MSQTDDHEPPTRLLTAGDVAQLLGVPRTWVYEQTRQGRIPHLRLGRYRRYKLESVMRWADAQESVGQPPLRNRGRRPTIADES